VVAACRRCNTKKGGRTPEQAGLVLGIRPKAPPHRGWAVVATGSRPDPTWEPYLAR
jgi:hypothetical protein